MRTFKKLILLAAGAVLLAILAWQGYLTFRYRLYDGYKAALAYAPAYEEGAPFAVGVDAGAEAPGMVVAAENESLVLYIDPDSANIAVYNKSRRTVTYAAPPGADEDPIASNINKSMLKSPVTIDYFNKDRLPARMNSFDHAVSFGQFKLESLDGGVRCVYTIGDTSSPTGIVPIYITEERLEGFLKQYEGTRQYTRNRMRYVESTDVPGYLELIPNIRTSKASLREIEELFIGAGYTYEDYALDMEGAGMDLDIPLHFVIAVEYRLDGDSLVVSVDTGRITEYAGGRIESIQLMRMFAAGGADEEGYLMVPNGSGSLIRFNNGKLYADEYKQYIYGQDPLMMEYITLANLGSVELSRIPYFGIYRPEQTVLALLESGESLAALVAGVAGKYNSYNYVYPSYVLRGSMSLAMFGATGNESTLPIVEANLPPVRISIRYSFLPEGYDGYSGMARYARESLVLDGVLPQASGGAHPGISEGALSDTQVGGDIPFYMDLIGSVMGQKFFASVSYKGQIPMTRYSDAAAIVDELVSLGVTRQVVNYQGWFNRGYYHDTADRIRPVSALGGVKELEALARAVESRGGKLYSDTLFQKVPFTAAQKRFNYTMETSRYYGGGMSAMFGMVNPVTLKLSNSLGYIEVLYDMLSPRFITRYVKDYNRAFAKYDLTGTSLRDLGDILASDRKRTGMIYREEAKEIVMYSLGLLEGQGKPIMVSGGNFYAWGSSDDLINVPLAHNALYLVDDEIPFYQMVLHGHIPYAGTPINLSDAYDEREITLRLVEYGASPHFVFTSESAGEMKYTGVNYMYSTHWDNWRGTAVSVYHKVNDALSKVSGSGILSHEILSGGLRRVIYDNGVEILINRSNTQQTLDGRLLEPMSFEVVD